MRLCELQYGYVCMYIAAWYWRIVRKPILPVLIIIITRKRVDEDMLLLLLLYGCVIVYARDIVCVKKNYDD